MKADLKEIKKRIKKSKIIDSLAAAALQSMGTPCPLKFTMNIHNGEIMACDVCAGLEKPENKKTLNGKAA
jgi:hypothetical protein